jgi:tetratricopeptide (TPR) repeat protein
MGIIEDERKNHEKALSLLFRATKYNDENPVTWRNIAIVYRNTNRLEDAVKYIKKAIDLDDRNTQNHMLLGNLYFAMQDYSAALNAYRKVTDIEPSKRHSAVQPRADLCPPRRRDLSSGKFPQSCGGRRQGAGRLSGMVAPGHDGP